MTVEAYFSKAPLSLKDLNSRLEACVTQKSLAPLQIRTKEDEKATLTFKHVFHAIEYPLQSFPDNQDPELIHSFKGWMFKLFPVNAETAETHRALIQLTKKIGTSQAVAKILPPQQALPIISVPSAPEPIVRYASVPIDNASMIAITQNHVLRSPEERLMSAFNFLGTPARDQTKAQMLQTILSLMVKERRVMSLLGMECQTALKSVEATGRFREGSDFNIRINATLETTNFPCPDSIEDPEEWAFRLQLPELFSQCIRCTHQVLYYPNQSNWTVLNTLGKRLTLLFASTDKPWKQLVKKLLEYVEAEICKVYLLQAINASYQCVQTTNQSPLVTTHKSWLGVEDVVAPFGSQILMLCKQNMQIYLDGLRNGNIPQDIDVQPYLDMEAVCKAYVNMQEQQQALYTYVYKELSSLITLKNKPIVWKTYLRDLCPLSLHELILPERLQEYQLPKIDPMRDFREKYMQRSPEPPKLMPAIPKPAPAAASSKQPVVEKIRRPKNIPQGPVEAAIPAQITPQTEEPKQFFFPRAGRVQRWFECPIEGPLDPEVFWDYADRSPSHARWMKIIHGITATVDQYHDIGIKTVWKNASTGHDDTLYVIPADLMDQNVSHRGFITYCIGEDGLLYHQGFVDKLNDLKLTDAQFIKKMADGAFFAGDFPDLQAARLRPQDMIRKERKTQLDDEITIHPLLGTVQIVDRRLNISLKLYRTKLL